MLISLCSCFPQRNVFIETYIEILSNVDIQDQPFGEIETLNGVHGRRQSLIWMWTWCTSQHHRRCSFTHVSFVAHCHNSTNPAKYYSSSICLYLMDLCTFFTCQNVFVAVLTLSFHLSMNKCSTTEMTEVGTGRPEVWIRSVCRGKKTAIHLGFFEWQNVRSIQATDSCMMW